MSQGNNSGATEYKIVVLGGGGVGVCFIHTQY